MGSPKSQMPQRPAPQQVPSTASATEASTLMAEDLLRKRSGRITSFLAGESGTQPAGGGTPSGFLGTTSR